MKKNAHNEHSVRQAQIKNKYSNEKQLLDIIMSYNVTISTVEQKITLPQLHVPINVKKEGGRNSTTYNILCVLKSPQ